MSAKRIVTKLYKNRLMKLLNKPTMVVVHDDYLNKTTMLSSDEYNKQKKHSIFIEDANTRHRTIKQVVGL